MTLPTDLNLTITTSPPRTTNQSSVPSSLTQYNFTILQRTLPLAIRLKLALILDSKVHDLQVVYKMNRNRNGMIVLL